MAGLNSMMPGAAALAGNLQMPNALGAMGAAGGWPFGAQAANPFAAGFPFAG